ncbi:hypothetical protein [Amycolatopsis minnesotensis]|uniref:Uncharacterized protein n=1 Tax=Amycolatopsis minnesotensis TaxID=337894 RepID=A0ABN2SLZ4_9PSEU
MTTLSPAVAEAYKLLRMQIYELIDSAEFLALKDVWSEDDHESLRQLIPDLLQVIRAVWHRHEPNWTGTCRFCLREWPCATARLIHREVIDPENYFIRIHENEV